MHNLVRIIVQAIVLGIVFIIFGSLGGFITQKIQPSQVPDNCKDWNKNHVMETSLFISGVFFSLTLTTISYFLPKLILS